jgi:hypothetical protein
MRGRCAKQLELIVEVDEEKNIKCRAEPLHNLQHSRVTHFEALGRDLDARTLDRTSSRGLEAIHFLVGRGSKYDEKKLHIASPGTYISALRCNSGATAKL